MSRCSRENPSSLDRCLRTRSPSSSVTRRPPSSSSLTSSAFAIVDLPEPDRPVKNTVNPCLCRGGCDLRSSSMISGYENHSGISSPSRRRRRSSVPEILSACMPGLTSSSGMNCAFSSTYTISRKGTIVTSISFSYSRSSACAA